VYVLGVCLSFFTTVGSDSVGREYLEHKDIIRKRLTSFTFWGEVVSIIPIFAQMFSGEEWPPLEGAMFEVQGMRLARFFWLVSFPASHFELRFRSSLQLVRMAVWIALSMHVTGCIWYSLASSNGTLERHLQGVDIQNVGTAHYLLAVKIGCYVVTGKPVAAYSEDELSLIAVSSPVGGLFIAFIYASVTMLLNRLNIQMNKHHKHIATIARTLAGLNVPPELKARILKYHHFLAVHHNTTAYQSLMHGLSVNLFIELRANLFSRLVMEAPFFQGAPAKFLRRLLQVMVEVTFGPGDVVIRCGDIGDQMYFVVKGRLEVLSPSNHVVGKIGENQYFGEIALLISTPRLVSIRTATYCLLAMISRESFLPLIESHKELKERMMRSIAKYTNTDTSSEGSDSDEEEEDQDQDDPVASSESKEKVRISVNGNTSRGASVRLSARFEDDGSSPKRGSQVSNRSFSDNKKLSLIADDPHAEHHEDDEHGGSEVPQSPGRPGQTGAVSFRQASKTNSDTSSSSDEDTKNDPPRPGGLRLPAAIDPEISSVRPANPPEEPPELEQPERRRSWFKPTSERRSSRDSRGSKLSFFEAKGSEKEKVGFVEDTPVNKTRKSIKGQLAWLTGTSEADLSGEPVENDAPKEFDAEEFAQAARRRLSKVHRLPNAIQLHDGNEVAVSDRRSSDPNIMAMAPGEVKRGSMLGAGTLEIPGIIAPSAEAHGRSSFSGGSIPGRGSFRGMAIPGLVPQRTDVDPASAFAASNLAEIEASLAKKVDDAERRITARLEEPLLRILEILEQKEPEGQEATAPVINIRRSQDDNVSE